MKRNIATRLSALSTAVMIGLAGCGGSGAGAGGPSASQSLAGSASTLTVGASSPTINSDGTSSVEVSAIAKDANNVAVSGQTVTFSTSDPGTILTVGTPKTDASGLASASIRITDPTARAIPVTASSGAAQGTVTVKVAGTSLTVSGQPVIAFGGSGQIVVTVRNSNNTGVPGVPVSLRSAKGNAVSESTAGSSVTDSVGQAKFQVSGISAGSDTLSASALGVSQVLAVSVSGDAATFESPTAASEALVNQAQPVRVRFLRSGVPLAGSQVQLAATRGVLGAATGVTDANGVFETTIQSAQAGQSTVSAMETGGTTATLEFEFVSRIPANMILQASPTTLSINTHGGSTSTSELIAKVRDSAGNPVKGVRVEFSAAADPSGGTISPAFALTNSAGIASTAFIAGPNPTGQNAIRVSASVPGTGVTAPVAVLTTVADALAVRMNTGNKITAPDTTTYEMPYAVVVSDAAGNPVEGAAVTVSYRPLRFIKGSYLDEDNKWAYTATAFCPSEDTDQDGVLSPAEDAAGDGDGVLEPSNVATVYVTTPGGKTDATGFALLGIKYPQGFSNWATIELQVTITGTSGSEVKTSRAIDLVPLASDIAGTTISPPGGIHSPFGRTADCRDPN